MLRGEGRIGGEDKVKNGLRIKHMITLDQIEFSFCLHIIYCNL